jgi:hypothetical protein
MLARFHTRRYSPANSWHQTSGNRLARLRVADLQPVPQGFLHAAPP